MTSDWLDAPNSRCRVCLVVDVRLHCLRNIRLLEVYEKLASKKLNADGRPLTLCYMCYSQLQRSCRFSDMCYKSEQLLRGPLQHGTKVDGIALPTAFTHNLVAISLPFMSIIDYSNKVNTEVYIKKELLFKEEENESNDESLVTEKYSLVEDVTNNVKEELLYKEEENESIEESLVTEESTLVEDVTINDSLTVLEQAQVKVNNNMNNVSGSSFCCDVCNIIFAKKMYLLAHIRSHSAEKLFVCKICKKSYTYSSGLTQHKRTHAKDKQYFACNMCNKSFFRKAHLVRHIKIHIGEKPHACNVCDKSFARKSSLVMHIRSHTGEKPFACNVCNKSFARNNKLYSHKKKHTENRHNFKFIFLTSSAWQFHSRISRYFGNFRIKYSLWRPGLV